MSQQSCVDWRHSSRSAVSVSCWVIKPQSNIHRTLNFNTSLCLCAFACTHRCAKTTRRWAINPCVLYPVESLIENQVPVAMAVSKLHFQLFVFVRVCAFIARPRPRPHVHESFWKDEHLSSAVEIMSAHNNSPEKHVSTRPPVCTGHVCARVSGKQILYAVVVFFTFYL